MQVLLNVLNYSQQRQRATQAYRQGAFCLKLRGVSQMWH